MCHVLSDIEICGLFNLWKFLIQEKNSHQSHFLIGLIDQLGQGGRSWSLVIFGSRVEARPLSIYRITSKSIGHVGKHHVVHRATWIGHRSSRLHFTNRGLTKQDVSQGQFELHTYPTHALKMQTVQINWGNFTRIVLKISMYVFCIFENPRYLAFIDEVQRFLRLNGNHDVSKMTRTW